MKFYAHEKAAALIESRAPVRTYEIHQPDSADKFSFWLIATLVSIFILLLFYSQRIQGLM